MLGSDIVYDDQLFAELNLPDFTPDAFTHNDLKLQTQSLDAIIEDNLRPHRTKGLKGPTSLASCAMCREARPLTSCCAQGQRAS